MPRVIRQVLGLFTASERWPLFGLLCLILVMALVEVAGIASIMPFMTLVANPDVVSSNALLSHLYEFADAKSTTQFLIYLGSMVLLLLILSNAVSAFTTWTMLRMVWAKNHSLSRRLLEQYLWAPYTYYLNRNTADLTKNILGEVSSVVVGLLIPLMQAFAKLTIVIAVFTLLLIVDVRLALTVALVLGGAYSTIYMFVRRRQSIYGRDRMVANALRYKTAAEAFGAIKEVKALGREEHFLRRFAAPSRKFSNRMARNQIVGALPRYAMDSVAFGGIMVIVLYMLTIRHDVEQILPVVGLYAFAGYRLMPALQQIFHSFTQVRFNSAALEELHRDLDGSLSSHAPARSMSSVEPLSFQNQVELRRVSFRYEGAEVWALRDVQLTLPIRTRIALVGTTGSGKTTLIDVILGLLEPQEGELLVDGRHVTRELRRSWQRVIGYVPQSVYLCDDTIAHNIAFGVPDDEIDAARVAEVARVANVDEFVRGMPLGYDTFVGDKGVRLSGGQRQRLGIARALYGNPAVLILDEATSALDSVTEDAVMQAIENVASSKTVIMIAHRLSSVRHCDIIYRLDRGRIVEQGSYDELISASSGFRALAKV